MSINQRVIWFLSSDDWLHVRWRALNCLGLVQPASLSWLSSIRAFILLTIDLNGCWCGLGMLGMGLRVWVGVGFLYSIWCSPTMLCSLLRTGSLPRGSTNLVTDSLQGGRWEGNMLWSPCDHVNRTNYFRVSISVFSFYFKTFRCFWNDIRPCHQFPNVAAQD